MQLLSCEAFAGQANGTFDLALGESTVPLTLVEVRRMPVHPYPGMLREPFSLMFRSATQVVLPQKLYPIRNADMGRFDLFLVPVGRDREGVLYQAVFN